MIELKEKFNSEVDKHIEFITENILLDSSILTQRSVFPTNERLKMIESIESLKII